MGLLERLTNWRERSRKDLRPPVPPAAAAAEAARAGNAALAAGELDAAVAHYRHAVALAPGDASAHISLGYGLLEQGQPHAARDVLERAVALKGGADAHYMLGQAHGALGVWDAARESYAAALAQRPDFSFAWRDLGIAHEHLGRLAEALEAFEAAYRHAPDLVDALAACARLHLELGRPEQCEVAARRWVEHTPQDGQAHFILAQSLLALERPGEALDALSRSASVSVGLAPIAYARGNALFRLDRFEEAAEAYGEAVLHAPGWVDPLFNRAMALERLGRHEEALAELEGVLARQPDHEKALYYRPIVLVSLRRVPEALDAVATARRLRPDDADMEWHYAFMHLLAGRMEEGWPAYESRWRATGTGAALARQSFPQPLWTGQPLADRTLLVYPEQGLGDMLQFARFIPVLEARGARVVLWAPESLKALLATVSPRVIVVPRREDLPAFDYQCPIMSLPLALGVTMETLPAQVPYLHADAERRRQWAARLGPRRGLRVGLVWSGNPAQGLDHKRSIPLATFSQIAVPGCEFVVLQNMVRPADRAALAAWEGLRFFGDEIATFADTAALAEEMDLVVSVCTSGAHLAGALGRPLWVLLAHRADWRWLLYREDSPWYPTARLFRQPAPGAWDAVLAKVRVELQRMAAGHG